MRDERGREGGREGGGRSKGKDSVSYKLLNCFSSKLKVVSKWLESRQEVHTFTYGA